MSKSSKRIALRKETLQNLTEKATATDANEERASVCGICQPSCDTSVA